MNYTGILSPLWEKLSKTLPENDLLNGQQISLDSGHTVAYLAVDSSDKAHFLLFPAPATITKLSKFQFKGLVFEVRSWIVADRSQQKYLDVVCVANSTSTLRRPFAKFCEDVLTELETSLASPDDALYRTCIRWQRFWAQEGDENFSPEEERGLLGELCMLELLIRKSSSASSVVAAWTGPDGGDQDFQALGIAIEVKTTIVAPPKLTVNNINQFDPSLFSTLLVAVYIFTSSEGGTSLFEKVRNIEALLSKDEETLDVFWTKLYRAGYKRQLENVYSQNKYEINAAQWFLVDDKFPKITGRSFLRPLDQRILKVQYTIELSGLPMLDFDKEVSKYLRPIYQA